MVKRDSGKAPQTPPLSTLVVKRILSRVDDYINYPSKAEAAKLDAETRLPVSVLDRVRIVASLPRMESRSHRDALLILLAFGFETDKTFNHTARPKGARTAGGRLGAEFKSRHIPAVVDAFQNIGKNVTNLARGNVPAFDSLLTWMNEASKEERLSLFDYIAADAALTARPVLPMPALRVASLTFAAFAKVITGLLQSPSGGAHEQFGVAALLEALLYEFSSGGTFDGLRVVTKNINTSDASAGTAADVQVMRRGRIEEVFEVSANNWRGKVAQAELAAANAGLARAHIIAAAEGEHDFSSLSSMPDIAVTDIGAFLRVVAAAISKPAREHALIKFYELLDTKQPNPDLTNAYVKLLCSLDLTESRPS